MPTYMITQPRLIVLAGLPGSGKTTYIEGLKKQGQIDNFCDDYQYGPTRSQMPELTDIDRQLIAGLQKGETWLVADVRYCDKSERAKLAEAMVQNVPGLKISYEYFENRPDLCELNVITRNRGVVSREQNLMYYYTKLYNIPRNAKVLKVYTE